MTHSTDDLRLDSQLCFAAYATAHAFNRVYKPLLDRLGLTYPQYLVLLVLWERDDLTVKEIGQRMFLDSGTLTPLLKRLEAAGVVRRHRDPEDERQVRISLTPKGRNLWAKATETRQEIACATGLPLDQIAAMRDELKRLRDSLDRYVAPGGASQAPAASPNPGSDASD